MNNLKAIDDDRDQYLGKHFDLAFPSMVAHDGRSSTTRAHLRIQASNFGSVQVLFAAAQGKVLLRGSWPSVDRGRCCFSGLDARDSA